MTESGRRSIRVGILLGLLAAGTWTATFAGPSRRAGETPPFPILTLAGTWFDDAVLPTGTHPDPDAAPRIGVTRGEARLAVPMVLGSRHSAIVHGFEYHLVHLRIQRAGGDAGPLPPQDLHTLAYSLGWHQYLSPTWRLTAHVRPELASDLHRIDGTQFHLQGGLRLDHRWTRTLIAGLGAGFGYDFGRPLVVPRFHLLWEAGPLWAELDLPTDAQVFLRARPGLMLGGTARLRGNRYRIGAPGATHRDLVRYSEATAGPALRWRLQDGLYLDLESGVAFARVMTLRDDGDRRTVRDLDPESAFTARAALSVTR